MARRRSATERKRRTREHVLADLGVNYVEKQALLCGFAINRLPVDYGIDLIVQTFNRRGEVENGWIPFQVRATHRIKLLDGGRAASCRVELADLRHWLNEEQAVILALYDGCADVAFWLDVRAYFAARPALDIDRAARRVSVSIPCRNVLDRAAMRHLARQKNALLAGGERVVLHVVP